DGIPFPACRIEILLHALRSAERLAILPERRLLVDEDAGIVANHGDRQFEGRHRIDAPVAASFAMQELAALPVDDDRAADGIGGRGRSRRAERGETREGGGKTSASV